MSILINLTEDQLELKSTPTILDQMCFWKKLSYQIDIPTKNITRIEIKRNFVLKTAFVFIGENEEIFEFSLQRASRKEMDIIGHLTEPFKISNYIQLTKMISKHNVSLTKLSSWGGVRLASA